jgi:hypothetical protein
MLVLYSSSCTTVNNDTGIVYTDLGKFQVEFGRDLKIEVPYHKLEGITQIPTRYFKALVIHELRADGRRIIPTRLYPIWWVGADETSNSLWQADTKSDAEQHNLELYWRWKFSDFILAKGLELASYSKGSKKYTLPYDAEEISLIYSIQFFIPNHNSKEIRKVSSEKFRAKWALEWFPPTEYFILEYNLKKAQEKSSKKSVLSVADSITEKHFIGTDAIKYFKLKLLALTLVGEYKSAFLEVESHPYLFSNTTYDYEFFTAQGLLSWKMGIDAIYYFSKAFEVLKQRQPDEKTVDEKLLECYLAVVLEKENPININPEKYSTLSDIVNYYSHLNKEELLSSGPISFLIMDPMP